MSTSIRALILADVVTTIAAITTPNLTGAQQVELFGANPVSGDSTGVVVFEGSEEKRDEGDDVVYGTYLCTMRVQLHLRTREGDRAEASGALDVMKTAIEVALMADHTRSGYAIDTKLSLFDAAIAPELLPAVYGVMTFTVIYQHGTKNPGSAQPTTG